MVYISFLTGPPFDFANSQGPAPKSWVRTKVFHPTSGLNTPCWSPQLGLRTLGPEEAGGGLQVPKYAAVSTPTARGGL